jgi:outer membrane autotransporter protein
LVAGVFADASLAGFGLHALLAYDGAEARTRRTIAVGASSATGRYDLSGFVAGVSADYAIGLGGYALTPKVGLTYVRTKREAVSEAGGSPFALRVDGDTREVWFADGGLTLPGTTKVGGIAVEPFAELGIRYLLDGRAAPVRGGLASASADAMLVSGVERDRTAVRLGAGFDIDVATGIRLSASNAGELGDTERHGLNVGLSVRF